MYPEYNDMNRGRPDEYNRLLEVKERATFDDNDSDNIETINYVQDLIHRKYDETTFKDSEDGKTVTIKRKFELPAAKLVEVRNSYGDVNDEAFDLSVSGGRY